MRNLGDDSRKIGKIFKRDRHPKPPRIPEKVMTFSKSLTLDKKNTKKSQMKFFIFSNNELALACIWGLGEFS